MPAWDVPLLAAANFIKAIMGKGYFIIRIAKRPFTVLSRPLTSSRGGRRPHKDRDYFIMNGRQRALVSRFYTFKVFLITVKQRSTDPHRNGALTISNNGSMCPFGELEGGGSAGLGRGPTATIDGN